MKVLNLVNTQYNTEMKRAWDMLSYCISSGACYDQTEDCMRGLGFYLPEDQFEAISKAFDIMVDLDIGKRHTERYQIKPNKVKE